MTDKEILTKAIDKAIANGWDIWGKLENIDIRLSHMNGDLYKIENKIDAIHFTVPELVFDHSFAKAFWGEEVLERTADYMYSDDPFCAALSELPAYKWHLQQMVILPDDERIKYLEKFLES